MGALVDYTVWKRALIAAAGLIVDRADSIRRGRARSLLFWLAVPKTGRRN
jgi:hypothetical protein